MIELQSFIAPSMTLIGALTVAALGFYQWRRQHGKANRSAVAESRRKAAETLWTQLEEINIKLRPFGEDSRIIDLKSDIRQLNETFLRNSFYLNDSLQLAVNTYLKQLGHVSQVVAKYQAGQEEWGTTMANPPSRVSQYREVNEGLEELKRQRSNVKALLLAATDA